MSSITGPLDLPLSHLYSPSALKNNAPLLVLLHGYGSNMHDLYGFAPYIHEKFAIVALQAPIPLGGPSYAWYNIYFDQPQGKWSDEQQGKQSVQLVLEVINKITKQIDVNSLDINLLGFSQGAILSYAAAMSHGHLSKVICLSGYINEELLPDNTTLNSCKETRFFASHGDQDQVIPVAWARNSSTRLKELGCNLEYHEFPVGHGVSPENFAALNSFLNG